MKDDRSKKKDKRRLEIGVTKKKKRRSERAERRKKPEDRVKRHEERQLSPKVVE